MNKDINPLKTGTALASGALVAAGLFTGLHLAVLPEVLVAIPLSIATTLGVMRFWPAKQSHADKLLELKRNMDTLDQFTGIDPKEVVAAITMGNDKLDRILMEATAIRAPNTIRRIKHIDSIGRKIIEDFRIDPKDVRIARTWLNSYLDETITLVKGYAQLSRTGARSAEAQKQLAGFDEMLDLLEVKFQQLLDKLLENDVNDFDVNMSVMRSRLNNEGMI